MIKRKKISVFFSRGEIASVVAVFSIGMMLAGLVAGRIIMQKSTETRALAVCSSNTPGGVKTCGEAYGSDSRGFCQTRPFYADPDTNKSYRDPQCLDEIGGYHSQETWNYCVGDCQNPTSTPAPEPPTATPVSNRPTPTRSAGQNTCQEYVDFNHLTRADCTDILTNPSDCNFGDDYTGNPICVSGNLKKYWCASDHKFHRVDIINGDPACNTNGTPCGFDITSVSGSGNECVVKIDLSTGDIPTGGGVGCRARKSSGEWIGYCNYTHNTDSGKTNYFNCGTNVATASLEAFKFGVCQNVEPHPFRYNTPPVDNNPTPTGTPPRDTQKCLGGNNSCKSATGLRKCCDPCDITQDSEWANSCVSPINATGCSQDTVQGFALRCQRDDQDYNRWKWINLRSECVDRTDCTNQSTRPTSTPTPRGPTNTPGPSPTRGPTSTPTPTPPAICSTPPPAGCKNQSYNDCKDRAPCANCLNCRPSPTPTNSPTPTLALPEGLKSGGYIWIKGTQFATPKDTSISLTAPQGQDTYLIGVNVLLGSRMDGSVKIGEGVELNANNTRIYRLTGDAIFPVSDYAHDSEKVQMAYGAHTFPEIYTVPVCYPNTTTLSEIKTRCSGKKFDINTGSTILPTPTGGGPAGNVKISFSIQGEFVNPTPIVATIQDVKLDVSETTVGDSHYTPQELNGVNEISITRKTAQYKSLPIPKTSSNKRVFTLSFKVALSNGNSCTLVPYSWERNAGVALTEQNIGTFPIGILSNGTCSASHGTVSVLLSGSTNKDFQNYMIQWSKKLLTARDISRIIAQLTRVPGTQIQFCEPRLGECDVKFNL